MMRKVNDRHVEALYEAHARGIYAFLAFRSGDRALAEDLLADTFERVLRARRGPLRKVDNEKAWLYRIALNVLRDHARHATVEDRALSTIGTGAPTSSDDLARFGDRDAVRRALATLS